MIGAHAAASACVGAAAAGTHRRIALGATVAVLGLAMASVVSAAPSCDRLVDGGVRDCNTRLSLDTNELLEQTAVTLTPEQMELARKQRPLRELAPTPEQYGQIQAYCRSHGEIRRRIGIQQGLCAEPPAD